MAETKTARSGPRRGAGGGGRRRFQPRRKVCRFCVDQVREIDYKQIQVLRSFMTERGKILAVFTAAFYGGLACGVLVLGFVAELAGYPPVFVATAALTAAAGALLVFSGEFGDERDERQA